MNRKEGRGNKDLKKRQAGSRGGCLKKGGVAGIPLRTKEGVEGGGGVGVWMNPLKKGNLWQKSFCQMLNEVLKICEKWYLLM